MTKKEFKKAVLRGQGRCILAAQNDPERYRELVLWACQRRISFDTQCEGARTWFVYQLVCCYEDVRPFVQAAAQSLRKCRSNGDWTVFCLSELLYFFASDGSRAAKAALQDKYRQLYDVLMARKRTKRGAFDERDDFEHLCVILAESRQAVMKIAVDVGKLCRLRPFYDGGHFSWLYAKMEGHLQALEKAAQTDENIAAFLKTCQEFERSRQKASGQLLSPKRDHLWLARRADRETVLQYARSYCAQTDPAKRAKALKMFRRCPFPEDPSPILADAEADFTELRDAAWQALANIRHPAVRDFALGKLQDEPVGVIPLLTKNYLPRDAALLEQLVMSVSVDFDDVSGWHGLHLDVLAMADESLKAPPVLLRHIYETTYCSCCREHALRQMGKRRLLTDEILRECLFDSNSDIRVYAKRCLKRRKQ